MNETERRELLIRNRDTMKKAFPWDTSLMQLCCANVCTMQGITADEASLKQTKALLKGRVGAFSNFRSTAQNVLVCMLDMSKDPAALLERSMELYTLLKREFFTSTYLPMVALILAEQADPGRYDELVSRTRRIYERMRSEHPFLTSSEDCALCALLAMTDQTDDELIGRMEEAYTALKGHFAFCGNEIQSLSHVIALNDGNIAAQCERVLSLVEALKTTGHKWRSSYELPVLGILAADPRPVQELADAIAANDEWLSRQKGFGFFSTVTRMQRMMYAALLTQKSASAAGVAAVNSTISMIIAEEVATIAAVSAASTASHSHS